MFFCRQQRPESSESGSEPARNHHMWEKKKKRTSWDELWGWKPILWVFFGCFFSGDSLLKETCSSLHFTRGEVLLSDPHHRCWRWKSPLCEVWENCVCVSSTRLKARILRYLTHRRLHPQTEMLQSGLQARGVGVCVFVCLRRRGFKGVTRR